MRVLRIALCMLSLGGLGIGPAAGDEAVPLPQSAAPPADIAPTPAPAETRQAIADTGVSLQVPEGFRVSQDYPGIGRTEDMTSVMVTLLDVPVALAAEAFSERALAQRGFQFQSSRALTLDGRDATRVDATQRIGGMSFRKWFVLLGDEKRSVLLTASTPSESEERYRDLLVRVLESATWSEARGPAKPAPVSFQR